MEFINILEMARLLRISRSKAYELVKIENFPIIKIGKCIRINKEELFKWLQNQGNVL